MVQMTFMVQMKHYFPTRTRRLMISEALKSPFFSFSAGLPHPVFDFKRVVQAIRGTVSRIVVQIK